MIADKLNETQIQKNANLMWNTTIKTFIAADDGKKRNIHIILKFNVQKFNTK